MKFKFAVFLSLVIFLAAGCATSSKQTSLQNSSQTVKAEKPSQSEIKAKVVKELEAMGEKELAEEEAKASDEEEKQVTYDIPITINAQVNYFIDYFQTKIPKRFAIWLSRSGRYVPMMRDILKQYGMPEDIVYMAMIESGFSCRAYSHAHASGPWQFIRATGRRYGLKINYWVDERRDPVKATHAAAKYMRDLYAEFGSWYLAAAAYNAGEAKIRKAMKRYQADDFWTISHRKRRYLKRETKQYVPKMIAAAIIAKEPEKYGFKEIKYQEAWEFDEVRVHPATSLSVAAKLAGVKTNQLRKLNPELSRWSTPPSGGMYSLRVPKGQKTAFMTAYAKLSKNERGARARAAKVRIHRGDTLGRIAKSFGVRLSDLMAMNPNLNPRRLRLGQVVFVPPSRGKASRSYAKLTNSRSQSSTRSKYRAPHRNQRKLVHVVKKGDTLWDIAQDYGISHRQIKRWNGNSSSRLKVGQKLVLYVPQAKAEAKVQSSSSGGRTLVYRVQPGDTLWDIAQDYGVSHRQIKRWNGNSSSRLKVGQKLVLHVPQAKAEAKVQSKPSGGRTLVYRVRRGDSLWKISRRFNVSPASLRRWNGLSSNRLTPGDRLTVRLGDNT